METSIIRVLLDLFCEPGNRLRGLSAAEVEIGEGFLGPD